MSSFSLSIRPPLAPAPRDPHLEREAPAPAATAPDDAHTWVVFDDDPTGTQPVAGVPVITGWDVEDFAWAFSLAPRVLYVLTNTRALDVEDARVLLTTATRNARAAAGGSRAVSFVSRGDSTLRGHFPEEVRAIAAASHDTSAQPVVLFVPAYVEAGRVTLHAEHLLLAPDGVRAVDSTEFARDTMFAYAHSHLPSYVREKDAAVQEDEIRHVPLDDLRARGAHAIQEALSSPGVRYVLTDAIDDGDLTDIAAGLDLARRDGREIVVQSGPSLPRHLAGLARPSVFVPGPLADDGRAGGLIVVGSHVPTTTRQLAHLLAHAGDSVTPFELPADQLAASATSLGGDLTATAQEIADRIAQGEVCLVSTSRDVISAVDSTGPLETSRRVSAGLTSVVRSILERSRPRFVVAKGGITSADTATDALGIRRAEVRGPMLPGIVSAWEAHDGLHPGIVFVIFAGNVGGDTALADVVARLHPRFPHPRPEGQQP